MKVRARLVVPMARPYKAFPGHRTHLEAIATLYAVTALAVYFPDDPAKSRLRTEHLINNPSARHAAVMTSTNPAVPATMSDAILHNKSSRVPSGKVEFHPPRASQPPYSADVKIPAMKSWMRAGLYLCPHASPTCWLDAVESPGIDEAGSAVFEAIPEDVVMRSRLSLRSVGPSPGTSGAGSVVGATP